MGLLCTNASEEGGHGLQRRVEMAQELAMERFKRSQEEKEDMVASYDSYVWLLWFAGRKTGNRVVSGCIGPWKFGLAKCIVRGLVEDKRSSVGLDDLGNTTALAHGASQEFCPRIIEEERRHVSSVWLVRTDLCS